MRNVFFFHQRGTKNSNGKSATVSVYNKTTCIVSSVTYQINRVLIYRILRFALAAADCLHCDGNKTLLRNPGLR